jgi:1-acyl-sn-glycerol-3-phosphate acyltransferase
MVTATQTPDASQDDAVQIPRAMFGTRTLCRLLMHLFSDYKVVGRENLAMPPFLVTLNHLSYFDAVAFAAAITMQLPAFSAKKYRRSLLAPFFWIGSPVWIEQESPDRKALMLGFKILKQGFPLAIAPEGHRSKTGGLLAGQEGAAFIATRADVPIVPMVVWGTERLLKRPRTRVRIKIGKSYRLPQGRAKGDALTAYTERIMCALAALLPEHYHGVYAGNPLIEEMAALLR